ncbi:MAG TPA: hypothetical protein VLE21_01560 [Candidatus Nitrosocosmicus sp.]|nr:hypothetical protein [Candidatus Nitrosocosmicus sp.]
MPAEVRLKEEKIIIKSQFINVAKRCNFLAITAATISTVIKGTYFVFSPAV